MTTRGATLTVVDAMLRGGLRVAAVVRAFIKESSMRWTTSLVAMALTTACSKSSHTPSPDASTDGITPQAFVEQLVTQTCDHAFSCMSQYPTTTGSTFADDWGMSQADCVNTDDDYLSRDQIAAAVTAGRITWDPGSATACLGALGFPASCADFFTTYDYPGPCYDALSGNVADGGDCTTSWECSGDMSDCTAGKCAPATAVRAHRR
jgi:hypothetical protein